ncbi:gamma-glutamylcyclotransferase [Nocardioides bruguierae]|uniref:gamma-glutamylcyclotransferase n=1 Tax=Nocardioides bruguierae TaxID=2945102 RepID=UPI0020223C41|nr:gamma-glutamylcyclotransferase [Nocardioides bruguierae]MCL8026755.1 gamma-glutamylcyclotransferase [Nocardioides bruguierae]
MSPRPVRPGEHASAFAPDPYPGERPAGSFVVDDGGLLWPLERTGTDWVVDRPDRPDLATWLAAAGASPLEERVPLVGYGSNACPGKVLRNATPLPAVHLACTLEGLASVWCDGLTHRGDVPVTLVEAPGHTEEAVLMLVDAAELAVLDIVEGRAARAYDLVRLEAGSVCVEGRPVTDCLAYVGRAPHRWPLLVAGPRGRGGAAALAGGGARGGGSTTSVEPAPLGPVVPLS